MTMMTRCAACATTFRLTTDQLVSHQGKVRCGQCGEVFNALEHLFDPTHVPEPQTEATPDSALVDPADTTMPDTATIDMFDAVMVADVPGTADPGHVAEPRIDDSAPARETEILASDATSAGEFHPGEEVPGGRDSSRGDDTAIHAPPPHAADAAGTPLLVGLAPRPRGFPWLSAAGALLAAVALAAQAAYHFRDQLAARVPAAKPYLELACVEIGCRILPPIDGQAISIESSDLQADNANRAVLILSAVLRNRAEFPQPLPMLELSLTDSLDAPVARRVLAPAEYARAASGIAAGGEVQVRVFVDAAQVKANGYRLYAFYP